MPHLGVPELLIVLVIFMLMFGVGKLPQIGKALGQGSSERALRAWQKKMPPKGPPTRPPKPSRPG